jgi:hypothetical protein
MSNYLKLLKSLGTYVDSAKDIYNYIPDDPDSLGETPGDVVDQYLPRDKSIVEETESSDWFTNDKEALIYPQDLFSVGNQAYIFFIIRDPVLDSAKILKRIGLYMPPEIKVKYGANWEEANISVDQVFNFTSDIIGQSGLDSAKMAAAAFGQKVVGGIGSKALGGDIGAEISRKTGILPNPQQGLLFKSVDFRRFSFSFEFYARSEGESESIRKIIKAFKWAMHPESNGEYTWRYPNIFDIYLLTPSHKYMFNISQSALESMDVDYGGAGATTFFKNTGAPVSIKMTLDFKELSVLTKDKIEQDY